MIETQCSQISETQSLILAQLDKDNLVSYNWIDTRSGKKRHDPKGPAWYEKEQAANRRESQSQTQEDKEVLYDNPEQEDPVRQDAPDNEVEGENDKQVDPNTETVDGE